MSRLLLIVVLCTGALGPLPTQAGHPPGSVVSSHPAVSGPSAGLQDKVPQKARDVLKVVQERHGAPLPGYVGGREFRNRERRLPRGRYREYDVNPTARGRPRDAERIVIEEHTQKAYYTPDHYQTFIPLN
jgi:ribonuclease T1